MKERSIEISTLISEAGNTIGILKQNRELYTKFKNNEYGHYGKNIPAAMVLSQFFIDIYTCIETFLFRVSQVFENNLDKESWHKVFLQKMTLDIENIRPAVILKSTALHLDEILRFRHFRRYYFNFDYDWDKIEMVEKKDNEVYLPVIKDIEKYILFLRQLLTLPDGQV